MAQSSRANTARRAPMALASTRELGTPLLKNKSLKILNCDFNQTLQAGSGKALSGGNHLGLLHRLPNRWATGAALLQLPIECGNQVATPSALFRVHLLPCLSTADRQGAVPVVLEARPVCWGRALEACPPWQIEAGVRRASLTGTRQSRPQWPTS